MEKEVAPHLQSPSLPCLPRAPHALTSLARRGQELVRLVGRVPLGSTRELQSVVFCADPEGDSSFKPGETL